MEVNCPHCNKSFRIVDGLSARAAHVLEGLGANTEEEIIALDIRKIRDLRKARSCGTMTVDEIYTFIIQRQRELLLKESPHAP